MKKICYFLLVATLSAATSLWISSCGKNEEPITDPVEDTGANLNELEINDLEFSASEESKTINIGKDLTGCKETSSENWCKVSLNSNNVTVSVSENTTYEARNAIVTLTNLKNNSKLSFYVTQKQNDAILADKDYYEISEEGGNIEVKVKSNIEYIVDLTGVDWIRQASTRGLQNSSIILAVAENNAGKAREAVVKITDPHGGISTQVTIKQLLNPQIIVEQSIYDVPEEGDNIILEIKSNVYYEIDLTGIDWVQEVSTTRGLNSSSVVLAVLPNDSGDNREAEVKLKDKNSDYTSSVTIKQIYTPLIVSPTSVSMYYDEKAQLTVSKEATWSVEDDFIVKVDENGLVSGRHVGSTKVIASCGTATAVCDVVIKPKYTLYDTPIFSWGAPASAIESLETHQVHGDIENHTYDYSFDGNKCYLGYYFNDNQLKIIVTMMNYSDAMYLRTAYYLLERYQPAGESGGAYYFMDAMESEDAHMVIEFSITKSGSSRFIQIYYVYRDPSSSSTKHSFPEIANKFKISKNTNYREAILRELVSKQ